MYIYSKNIDIVKKVVGKGNVNFTLYKPNYHFYI